MQISVQRGLKIVVITTILVGLVLLISMFSTTPDGIGPFGITVWFVGLLIMLSGVLTLAIYSLKRNVSGKNRDILFTSSLRQGILFSTLISGLLALSSLHQLAVKDMVLVSVLVGLLEFYLRRISPA